MDIQIYMRSTLAAAVVFIGLLMSHAQTSTPTQAPEQTPGQPTQTAPPTSQPTATPDAQEPAPANAGQENKPDTEAPAPKESTPEVPTTQQPAKPPAPEPPQQTASDSPKKASAKKPKKKPTSHRAKQPDPPSATPTKKVVANGGTSETEIQISPRMSDKQQADERQKISNLIWAAETNLQKVSGRTLNDSQEEMAQQIRMYMEQSKQASGQGDLQRAKNLASKADLLSVELVGKE
jgi:hypothetical protein